MSKSVVCECPKPFEWNCSALGTNFGCLPWCDYLKEIETEDEVHEEHE